MIHPRYKHGSSNKGMCGDQTQAIQQLISKTRVLVARWFFLKKKGGLRTETILNGIVANYLLNKRPHRIIDVLGEKACGPFEKLVRDVIEVFDGDRDLVLEHDQESHSPCSELILIPQDCPGVGTVV